MNSENDRIIIEGLAAWAESGFAMGWTRERVRDNVLEQWERTGRLPGAFAAAAEAVANGPQPLLESAEETERARPIREMLGVQPAEEILVAALEGRELLKELAAEFG